MTIEKIIKENQNEIIDFIVSLATKKEKKISQSISLKFCALGKKYDKSKSIDNYINLLMDLSKIHPYETFKPIMKSFIGSNEFDFSDDHQPHVTKISEGFFLSKKISNEHKIKHLEKISELLNIPIKKL